MLGADCTELTLIIVLNGKDNPIRTANYTLLWSALAKKQIRFGAGNPGDKEITNQNISVNRISSNTSGYIFYAPDTD